MMAHTCPDSGGAHHFHPDENGVGMCSCGEVELTPEEQLELVEIMHEGQTNPLPPEQRDSLYRKIQERIREAGGEL